MKLQQVEWFAARRPQIARQPRAADRRRMVAALEETGDPLAHEYGHAAGRAETAARVARRGGNYPLLSGGDVNLYSLFVERALSLVRPDGLVGLVVPSGIAADKTAARFFRSVATEGRLRALYDFENRRVFFPDQHASFKFCVFVAGRTPAPTPTNCAFYLHDVSELSDPERCFQLAARDFAGVNPNTGTAPVLRTRRDAALTTAIYGRLPVLVDRSGDPATPAGAWPLRYETMFHMTNDSHRFRRRDELEEQEGAWPIGGNRFDSPVGRWLPLYEGKMVQAFDHRAASIVVNADNLHRPAQPQPATPAQRADPAWLPEPQYWVPESACGWTSETWVLGFKEITAPTNVRTFIAALLPAVGFGNTVPILRSQAPVRDEWLLLANFNAAIFDFLARQKVQAQHLNLYIVEQIPVIALDDYSRQFGKKTAREIVTNHALRLTYTSHDLEPFARDLGYNGAPFKWNPEERRHLRARLDALYFHLYGISNDDAEYILSTFPIVREQDEAEFGRYRTSEMIISYMNALEAGDTDVVVSV